METRVKEDTDSIVKLVDYAICICRVCTLSTECQNIFKMNYSDLTFADLFYYSTRIQLSADDNPYHLCLQCVGKLLNAYEFIVQCEKSWYAQKQTRLSAQLDTTPVPNIIIIKDDNSTKNDVIQPKNAMNSLQFKPIASKSPVSIVDLTTEETTTPASQIETHHKINPGKNIVLITDKDGYVQSALNTIDIEKIETNKVTPTQLKDLPKLVIKGNNEKTIIIQPKHISDKPIPVGEEQNKDILKLDIIEETPKVLVDCNWISNPKNSEPSFKSEEGISCGSMVDEITLSGSDHDSDNFGEILKSLAEAEIDSNYEGSDGSLTDEDINESREDDKPPYKCVKCGREFKKIHTLNRHLLAHLSGAYYCNTCDKEFRNQHNLTKHMQIHATTERVICEHCGKDFKNAMTLKSHQISQHSNDGEKFIDPDGLKTCKICAQIFESVTALKSHYSSMHEEKEALCNICGKTFVGAVNLKRHLSRHDENRRVPCLVCNKTFSCQVNLKQHIYTHTGVKPYQCHICGKRCVQSQHLKAHIRMHTGDRPYKCKYCENCFTTSTILNNHIKGVHINERPHTCKICNKGFLQRSGLTTHFKTHIRTKNLNSNVKWTCTLCNLNFPSRGEMLAHNCTHMHLAPFACNVCNKRFRVKQLLTVHERIHTGERPFKCKFCPQAFRSRAGLTEHTFKHTGEKRFVCDICGKQCTQRQQLVSHMRVHTKAKPYKCDVCFKAFAIKGNLTVHLRTHTLEVVCKCEDCGQGFYTSNALKRHQMKCKVQQTAVVVYQEDSEAGNNIQYCNSYTESEDSDIESEDSDIKSEDSELK